MAIRKPSQISSGIVFTETDLTVVTESAGTFAGAMIGLTEKGPAFEIMPSSKFEEREIRMGGLNPDFPSSYYARQFLQQAANYKEVRVLGLEGYNELTSNSTEAGEGPGVNKNGSDKSFAIVYDQGSVSAAAGTVSDYTVGPVYTAPLIADRETVACILKPRRTNFTSQPLVTFVEVTAAGTDDEFELTIHFQSTQAGSETTAPLVVKCSLRPEKQNYISNVFGRDPLDTTKVQGLVSPLWVEFVIPSVKQKWTALPYIDGGVPTYVKTLTSTANTAAYYYPGDIQNNTPPTALSSLNILAGDISISSSFVYPTLATITGITKGVTDVTVTTAAAHGLTDGDVINISSVVGFVTGTTNVNGNWEVVNASGTTFDLVMTASQFANLLGTYTSGGVVKLSFLSTWEAEVMNLGGTSATIEGNEVPYQTPITPWFVSDVDTNGDVKRLFRVWSISDGESANTEIKVEISNIDPSGNLGKGSFDLFVRAYSDREDTSKVVYESFTKLTMDPKSDNFIRRRIGDGEIDPLKSRYIFIELNSGDTIPSNALPYGHEGYPNVDNTVMPDVIFTTGYDLTKPVAKQMLGLPNNNMNKFATVAPDQLAFKNVLSFTAANTGKGFHLNPNVTVNPSLSLAWTKFNTYFNSPSLTGSGPYTNDALNTSTTSTTAVTGPLKAARLKYVVNLFGGFDGFNVYSERSWADPLSKDYEAFAQALEVMGDNESLDADFSVLVTPDVNFESHSTAAEAALEMCTRRGDALYLSDFAYDELADPTQAKISLESNASMHSNFNATYFPYCQIEDTINKTNLWLPPSIIAYGTIAATATNENVWQPPAGSLRTIANNLVRTRRRMKLEDREILKSANINPVTIFPGSGFEITESRTTQETFSALSFIHNRLLLGYAKKALNQSLRPLLHQLKTGALEETFVNVVTPIFDRIKKLNGVEDFSVKVVKVEEDRTILYGQITITPLYSVEQIAVEFQLSNGGTSFSA